MEERVAATERAGTCQYFHVCMEEGRASAICLINCEAKYRRCTHRPDWKTAELMQHLEAELKKLMRMELDELIEIRLTRYAAEADSQELKDEIRKCLQRIAELTE